MDVTILQEDGLLDLVFAIIFFFIMAYVLVLPFIACYQLSKTWKLKNKIILFTSYYGLLSCLSIILFVIPDYYWRTYYWDIRFTYQTFFGTIALIFFLLPVMYPGVIELVQFFKEIISLRRQSKLREVSRRRPISF